MKTNAKESVVAIAHLVPLIMALAVVVTAFSGAGVDAKPSEDSAIQAPTVALTVAAMLILNAVNGDAGWRRIRVAFIGVGSVLTAWFWLAHDAAVHPADFSLLFGFGLFGIVALIAAVLIVAFVLLADFTASK